MAEIEEEAVIYSFFEPPRQEGEDYKYKCKHCKKEYSASPKINSNLITHLGKKDHTAIYSQYEKVY